MRSEGLQRERVLFGFQGARPNRAARRDRVQRALKLGSFGFVLGSFSADLNLSWVRFHQKNIFRRAFLGRCWRREICGPHEDTVSLSGCRDHDEIEIVGRFAHRRGECLQVSAYMCFNTWKRLSASSIVS